MNKNITDFSSVSDPYLSNPDPDPAKNLNPDPDPSYFFTLSEKKLKLLHYYKVFIIKRSRLKERML